MRALKCEFISSFLPSLLQHNGIGSEISLQFGLSVIWLVGRSVGRSFCQNFLKGRDVSLPCSYRSTFFLLQGSDGKCHLQYTRGNCPAGQIILTRSEAMQGTRADMSMEVSETITGEDRWTNQPTEHNSL